MYSDLSKNTPEDLHKLYMFVVRSAASVKDEDLKIWSEWLDLIKQAISDSEFSKNELPFKQE